MKTLLLSGILLLNLNAFSSFASARGNEKGNGGSGDEVDTVVVQKNIEDIIFKINRFFKINQQMRTQFEAVNFSELATLAGAVKVEIAEEEIFDKDGVNRTCLNFPASSVIQCNKKKILSLKENTPTLYVLIFHELLGLMNIEESSSSNQELIENYKISQNLRRYVTKVDNYDLAVRDSRDKGFHRIEIGVESNKFESHSCRVRSLELVNSVLYESELTAGEIKRVYEELNAKGYIFDSNYTHGKSYQDRSLRNGLTISLGRSTVLSAGEPIYYREVDIQMIFEEKIGKEYAVGILNKREKRLLFLPEYNLKKSFEWGLKNIPKCTEKN